MVINCTQPGIAYIKMTFSTVTCLRMRIYRALVLMAFITGRRRRRMVIPQPSGVKMTVPALQALLMGLWRTVELMAGSTCYGSRRMVRVSVNMTNQTVCFYDVGVTAAG